MDIIVGVITCRRPDGLKRLLDALFALDPGDISLTILVVDNACDAATAAVVARFQTPGSPFALVYLEEPEPGIVAARNRCIDFLLSTNAAALAFIDDDEWPLHSDWLQSLTQVMQTSEAPIVAGDVLSVAEPGTPSWALEVLYGASNRQSGDPVNMFYTGNVLIAREVLKQLRPAFDARFALTGASDYHFALRCARAGFNVVFADAPVVEAFPKDRATVRWFLRRGLRSGIGFSRSHLFEEASWLAVLRCLAMTAVRITLGVFVTLSGLLKRNKGMTVKGLFRLASAWGTLAGLVGARHEEYRSRHTG